MAGLSSTLISLGWFLSLKSSTPKLELYQRIFYIHHSYETELTIQFCLYFIKMTHTSIYIHISYMMAYSIFIIFIQLTLFSPNFGFALLLRMMFLSWQIGDYEEQRSPCHATHPPLGHVSQSGGCAMLFSHNILDPLLVLHCSLPVHPSQDLIEVLVLPGTLYS